MGPQKPSSGKKDFLSSIWPGEREVISAPHRLKYVRKLIKPKTCVFCTALKNWKSPESLVVFKASKIMVILNKYPYNNGHLLLLPCRHESEYHKLSDRFLWELHILLKHSMKILKKVYAPKGFNMGMNLGEAAGAGIPGHLHYHLVPRWHGDTNFFPLIAETKLVVETVEQSYNKLKPHFDKFKKLKKLT